MAKLIANSVFDAALDKVATSNQMLVCSGDPTNRTEALAQALADEPLTGGDFTNADGDVSGRKVTVAQQTDILVDTTGLAATVCLIDATELLLKTDLASTQNLTQGNTVTVNAFDYEIRDPA